MRYFYRVALDRVVDGDTIDVVIDLGFDVLHKARIRLHGVNTPETRTRDLEEKALGLAATSYVEHWVSQTDHFYIQTLKDAGGKYGRILGKI